ncbi:hypothetical protein [Antrihabitans sp. YC2-6]|uniref:hypothetical protein n=1 Tax=Antrihabitans sp. YC2-6 TaxID=2799498 RepID=UPI0018F60B36|nr:hypothetical protein [Antrihabitans sp. YC2-6]MBJ8343349.1 hypothetical protein [Antrihabitans sp. YC2-6]
MTDRLIVAYLRALLPFTTVLLIAAAAFEAYRGAYVATSFIVAYLLWILGESRITVNQPRESSAEHRTLPLYATARVATALTGALWPVATTTFRWWQLAPIVAFVAGVALRTWSIRTLGTFYSHHVVTSGDVPDRDPDGRLLRRASRPIRRRVVSPQYSHRIRCGGFRLTAPPNGPLRRRKPPETAVRAHSSTVDSFRPCG